jgi:hypothetical protein
MAPNALPNLYCSPNDIFDNLGSEGVQLRLDDHNQASGQVLQVTAATAVGGTSISITALIRPLLAGTVLEFDGGGMPALVQAVLTATAPIGSTSITVSPLVDGNGVATQVFQYAQATDSGVNLALAQRLIKGCIYGTSQVQLYCLNRYNDSDLKTAFEPNRWATALASRWVSSRRGQSPPTGVVEQADEALDELRQVRVGMLSIPGIGTRSAGWPFLSNFSLDIGYDYNKLRVEPQLSEGTPTQYPQHIDYNAALFLEL